MREYCKHDCSSFIIENLNNGNKLFICRKYATKNFSVTKLRVDKDNILKCAACIKNKKDYKNDNKRQQ